MAFRKPAVAGQFYEGSEQNCRAALEQMVDKYQPVQDLPDKKIWEIDILPEEEKRQLMVDFNDTAVEFPGDKTIYRLFEDQVDAIPDHGALVFEDETVTFRFFDERANRLAHCLRRERGIRVGDRVAVLMERSIDLIVSLMGVMKSGAAYVPLDPALPAEIRKPPLITNSPLTSRGPFLLVVGPWTITTPPVITAVPFESRPSPSALTTTYPPLM